MSRELPPQQAFQTHCLAQMGVVSWLSIEKSESASDSVTGTVFMPVQPWPVDVATTETSPAETPIYPESTGFRSSEPAPVPVAKLLPEEKDPLVHHLREQLNAGPEIIVEDLQPIEELAVDIVVEPDPALNTHITRLNIYAYALSNKLLILSDVPEVFSQAEEVERLALKMGQALLKQSVDEWQGSAFSWPGALRNPHFWKRTDWLFGALESYVGRLVKDFPETPLLVLAGAQITQLVADLPPESLLKHYPTARIVSLSELYRIPELRKEAWQVMQSSFFR
ncbi:hypothetical protein HGG82_14810 [Marinomonas sp. M1K-6]|uniref:Uncharacterized protein n=1 Tax=Marinomonas profundi TaxID=2726122 RepID=A0A847RA05_9GAMM|nr:hypothetical protein [Marinomonas profundi]NLQ18876.1 hypothetical protein [Marinomonas profundi]UDV01803.1 hypothetical protein J8N69_09275 [Marinomonas profundi]